jgi:hypothetical protein
MTDGHTLLSIRTFTVNLGQSFNLTWTVKTELTVCFCEIKDNYTEKYFGGGGGNWPMLGGNKKKFGKKKKEKKKVK